MNCLYKVTTEGDCEGRSTNNLGIWHGAIADIAFHLADRMFYSLNFEPVTINKPTKISKEKVVIKSWTLEGDVINPTYLGSGDFSIEKSGCRNDYILTMGKEAIKAQKRKELLKEKERIERELNNI